MRGIALFVALLTACGGDDFTASQASPGAVFDDAGPSAAGTGGTVSVGGSDSSAGHGGEDPAGSLPDAAGGRPDSDAGGVSVGGSPPVQNDSGAPEGGAGVTTEPDAAPPLVCPKYEEPAPSGTVCVCISTHARCGEFCAPISPSFGCGVGDCAPCDPPPDHATVGCGSDGCEWTCDEGYHVSRDGIFCAPDCDGMTNCGENEACVSRDHTNGCGDPDCTPCPGSPIGCSCPTPDGCTCLY